MHWTAKILKPVIHHILVTKKKHKITSYITMYQNLHQFPAFALDMPCTLFSFHFGLPATSILCTSLLEGLDRGWEWCG